MTEIKFSAKTVLVQFQTHLLNPECHGKPEQQSENTPHSCKNTPTVTTTPRQRRLVDYKGTPTTTMTTPTTTIYIFIPTTSSAENNDDDNNSSTTSNADNDVTSSNVDDVVAQVCF